MLLTEGVSVMNVMQNQGKQMVGYFSHNPTVTGDVLYPLACILFFCSISLYTMLTRLLLMSISIFHSLSAITLLLIHTFCSMFSL